MAIQSRSTIKNWFKTRLKPTQAQFWDTWDSFWHKNDKIPVGSIENLDSILSGKASQEGVNNALTAVSESLQTLEENKVDKVEGKQLSSEDYTTEEKTKLANLGTAGWKLTDAPELQVGDLFGGGRVFFIAEDKTFVLVAALEDAENSPLAWNLGTDFRIEGTTDDSWGNLTGAGINNTDLIIAALGEGVYAAKVASAYQGGDYSGWYLGSATENDHMMRYLADYDMNFHDGSEYSDCYWSSSHAGAGSHVYATLYNGGNPSLNPYEPSFFPTCYVRPIRKHEFNTIDVSDKLTVEAGRGVEVELDPETKKIKLSSNLQLTSDDESVMITETDKGYDLSAGGGSGIAFEYDYSATAKLDDDLMTVREIMPPPAAGMFNSIACSSDGRVVIVAAQGGRLWYSTNYGKSFNETRPAGDADKTWGAVKCSYDGRLIVAACNGGGRLWKSTDFCYSWSELQPAGNFDKNWGNCLAVSKLGKHIIAGALYGRLYKSDDSGETWSELQPKPATNWTWFAASVSEDGQTILAGTNFAGDVYLSKDGGATFTQLPFPTVFGDLLVSADGQRLCVPNRSEDPEGGSLLTSFDGGEQFNSYNENYWMPYFFGDYKTTWMSRNGSKIAALIDDCIALSNLRDGGEWTFHRLRMDSFPTIITGTDDGSIIYAAEYGGSLYRIDMKRINDPWQKIEVDVSRDTAAVDPYFEIGAAQGYLIVDEENGEVELSGDTFNIVELNSGYDYLKNIVYLPASTARIAIDSRGFIINNVTRFLSSLLSVKLLDLQNMEQLDEPMLEEFVDSLPQHQSPVGYIRVSIEVTDELKSIAAEKGWTLKAVSPS